MIRINLLPVRASKKSASGRNWLIVLLLVLGASVGGNYVWLHQTDAKVEEVKERIARDRVENKKLEGVIGQVKDLKKAKDEMKQKLGVLNKLKEGRQGPVRMMDELSSIIPAHVWITSWEETGGGVIISGTGASHEEVAAFMKAMRQSKFFDAVTLKNDRQVKDNEVTFSITCNVKYSA
jgi:type IV pilus assembly protein PilN